MAKLGLSMARVSLAWMLSKRYVIAPIVGCTSPDHVREAAAAPDVSLSPETIRELEELYVPHVKTGAF